MLLTRTIAHQLLLKPKDSLILPMGVSGKHGVPNLKMLAALIYYAGHASMDEASKPAPGEPTPAVKATLESDAEASKPFAESLRVLLSKAAPMLHAWAAGEGGAKVREIVDAVLRVAQAVAEQCGTT